MSGTGGILMISTLTSLNAIGPTPYIPLSTSPSIWMTSIVSCYLSTCLPRISMSIPSILIPTVDYISSGERALFLLGMYYIICMSVRMCNI
jgi:hypothetical protein